VNTMKINALLVSLLAATAVACGSDPPPSQMTPDATPEVGTDATPEVGTDATTDNPQPTDNPTPTDNPPPTDNPTPTDGPTPMGLTCATYCAQLMTNCTGANTQYNDMAECMTYCAAARWPLGTEGATSGNTLACRIYHGGAPAMMMPGTHCPHAGPTGDGVCGSLMFRTDAPAMYRRVDRMGMPAVSTALIGTARKNAYNDVTTRMEHGTFVADFVGSLTGLHTALDRHLRAANLTPCSMSTTEMMVGGLPQCLGQEYAPGASVASLVVAGRRGRRQPGGRRGLPQRPSAPGPGDRRHPRGAPPQPPQQLRHGHVRPDARSRASR
jgi:hypothetical protein